MIEDVIRLSGVGRRFGRRWVLRNLDLAVPQGSVFGLLGRNGAGKTTAIRMLFGLLRPHEGQLSVEGIDPRRDPVALRRAVGYAGEDLGLSPGWRVSRILRFASRVYDDWNTERAEQMRRHFNLPLERKVRELSAGMRARLGLLLTLVRRPRVLLLDEPFGGLDVVIRREVIEGVIDILPGSESTVLVTSHLVHELERLVDHVAMLAGGRIEFAGTLESLRSSVRRVRLGPTDLAPDLADWTWVRRAERFGRGWELVVFRFDPSLLDRIRDRGFSVEEVLPLDLEEIAHEYLRDDREEAA